MNYSILVAALCSLFNTGHVSNAPPAVIRGDYVEARTASVFAGPCHYNGEVMTDGREAIMAWNVTSGSFNHVDLSGVRAVAVVSCDANLADETAARRFEITIDSSASAAQAAAMVDALQSHFGKMMGEAVNVRRAPVTFVHRDRDYQVEAKGFATLSVQGMPNDECCKQPNLVWYSPLASIEGRKVGFTSEAAYTAGTICDIWERTGENSAFYGAFAF
jgi:hypothetical protein